MIGDTLEAGIEQILAFPTAVTDCGERCLQHLCGAHVVRMLYGSSSENFVVHGSVWSEAPRNAIVSPNRIRLSRRAADDQHTRVTGGMHRSVKPCTDMGLSKL